MQVVWKKVHKFTSYNDCNEWLQGIYTLILDKIPGSKLR